MATKTLLIVAHAPSPNTEKLAQAAYEGANHHDININVVLKSPQDTQPNVRMDAFCNWTSQRRVIEYFLRLVI